MTSSNNTIKNSLESIRRNLDINKYWNNKKLNNKYIKEKKVVITTKNSI